MSEISQECQHNLCENQCDEYERYEKRPRPESLHISSEAIIDDGFTLVTPRHLKRQAMCRSSSNDSIVDRETINNTQENGNIKVSVTSKEILMKQMALAKLLLAENIQSIFSVKYKGPYKVLIEFGDMENAQKLLINKKFAELDYRCQLTEGLEMIYGIVRNIDLNVPEKEMVESFNSEIEILSIKRLKRFLENDGWVESESVRVCFKSSSLPPYILVYGCRFKVDPFTFPVTQCSSCWRYGHSKNACPIKKVFCPKCGNQHDNCETKLYTCINCKGNHMALNRTSCPVFYKEKEIRKIMCEENCKYRKALLLYSNRKKLSDRLERNNINEMGDVITNNNVSYNERNSNKTYRDVLVAEVEVHNEDKEWTANCEEEDDIEMMQTGPQKIRKRKKKWNNVEDIITEDINKDEQQYQGDNKEQKDRRKRFSFMRIFMKIKEICFLDTSLENKMKLVFKVITEEVKTFIVKLIKDSDVMNNFFNSI